MPFAQTVQRAQLVVAVLGVSGMASNCGSSPSATGASSGASDASLVLPTGDAGAIDAAEDTAVATEAAGVQGGGASGDAADAGARDAHSAPADASTSISDASDLDAPPLPAALPLAQVLAAKPELIGLVTAGRAEGPSWSAGQLFFSVVSQSLYRIKTDGKIYRYLALKPNGSFLLADGSILLCDDQYTMVQVFPDGKVGIVGNGGVCNDISVDVWGNIYFSDFIGTVYRVTPAGVQTKAITSLRQPNGVEVDPASKYLYILPRPADLYRVAIGPDGPIGAPEKVGQFGAITDGCAFDAWGNLWVAVFGLGQIAIFDPTQQKTLGSLSAGGAGVTNLTFGEPNRDTLFVTTESHGIFKIPVGARGFATHPGAPQYALRGYVNIAPIDELVP